MPARIDICNQAIDEIGAARIASVDEQSLEAESCAIHYPQVVSEMLGGGHDWSFQNRRVLLAGVTNGRASEWAYAYAVPADMGNPIRVIPDFEGAGLGLPVPLAGEPYAEAWSVAGRYFETPFIIENGVIYTNVETATLEYGINDIEATVIPPLTVKAIVKDLASRLAVPVKKDQKLKATLQGEAELAWSRAISDDLNRQPRTSGDYVAEAMAARDGYLSSAA